MKRKKYSDEFKQQIPEECRLISNVALIARRHEISKNTIYT
ncbi:transposase [Anoxybacter fermentans]|nr:transposase [Anoxybacter fermentans]